MQDDDAENPFQDDPLPPADQPILPDGSADLMFADGGCDCGTCESCCCLPTWRTFADFLYLTPRNADVAFAVPVNGVGPAAVPNGPIAVLDPKYEPGFRIGAGREVGCDSRISGSWTWYESNANGQLGIGFARPLLLLPPLLNAAAFQNLLTNATYGLDFNLADVNYHAVTHRGCDWWLGYLLGVRYGRLEQEVRATYNFAQQIGIREVTANVNFDGIGVRLGLEGERLIHPCSQFALYGRGVANFLAGEFRTSYSDINTTTFMTNALATYSEDRIVPLMELEMGVAWVNKKGNLRIRAGYMMNAWLNTITVPSWIEGLSQFNFNHLDDTLTFDGLTGGIEYRY